MNALKAVILRMISIAKQKYIGKQSIPSHQWRINVYTDQIEIPEII
jgi:hypothetical protein